MSVDEEISKNAAEAKVAAAGDEKAEEDVEKIRSDKILKAKELYSQGSRNYLVKSYSEAADQLSEVCALYDELYGEGCPELGMPYLLYAKSLIALAVDENKVLDVPDEADEDDDDDDDVNDDDGGEDEAEANEKKLSENAADAGATKSISPAASKTNGAAKKPINEADSTAKSDDVLSEEKSATSSNTAKATEDAQVSNSSNSSSSNNDVAVKNGANGDVATEPTSSSSAAATVVAATPVIDGEKPSTSNGDADTEDGEDDEETEAVSNMRLAWEILELAAKIFSRQGLSGLPNLAEVQTELANIEFENNIMDAAREDYEKALKIYKELPKNYHRAMAEIHYKIGLTYLMQQLNKEGAASLKEACDLIDAEIVDIKAKDELTEKDKNNIQDMEETKQEIRAKIDEIEETQAQNIAEVRAALDSYIKPIVSQNADGAGTSSSSKSASSASTSTVADAAAAAGSSSSITSSSTKPNDISHLIKRKKPEESNSEAEASPAKRPAV